MQIGLGTAAIGRPQYINIKQQSPEVFHKKTFIQKGVQVLDSAYEQGIRYFDTAPGYGLAEQLVIDWVNGKADNTIEVASKWGYSYVANFDPSASVHEVKDHSLKQLNQQWEQTKKLLPNLSTLQIHSATFDTGVLDDQNVLERLADIKSKHKIFIGLTTTGHNQNEVIKKALSINVNGTSLFDAYQITFNVLDQSLIEMLGALKKSKTRIIIKEALANGRVFPNNNYPHHAKIYKVLKQLGDKYHVGIDAIAIKFCIQSINPYSVLSGASLPNQISQNLKANHFELNDAEMSTLRILNADPNYYWKERKKLSWN